MAIHVDIPTNRVVLLEFIGLVFDISIVLENELEIGRWTLLDEVDRYFYATISSVF